MILVKSYQSQIFLLCFLIVCHRLQAFVDMSVTQYSLFSLSKIHEDDELLKRRKKIKTDVYVTFLDLDHNGILGYFNIKE
jgi:hypothetical protein